MNLIVNAEILRTLLVLVLFFEHGAHGLQLLELRVPTHVPLGTRAVLTCRWQLGPTDVLYSVKWYKDGKEFYRHVPRDSEPHRRFQLPGVDVDDADQSGDQLVLAPATPRTGGRYRCEVSGEGPLFPTVTDHADMDVVALPDQSPTISGLNDEYQLGDRIQATCTSGGSRPATKLSWYINDNPLPPEKYSSNYKSLNSLIITSSTLDCEINEVFFRKNSNLIIKCLAIIAPIYWKSVEKAITIENIHISSNITSYKTQKTKRADRDSIMKNLAIQDFYEKYTGLWLSLSFLAFLYIS